jgi:hypothetical protein
MLSLCGVLAVAGCGGRSADAGGGANQSTKLSSGAWNLTLPLTLSGGFGSGQEACTSLTLTLDLIDNDDALSAFMGANGSMVKPSFDRAKDGSLTLAAPVTFGAAAGSVQSPFPAMPDGCSATSVSFDSLTLRGQDMDGDGRLDHLTGEGKGSAGFYFGDEADMPELAFTVAGVPDQTGPSIVTGSYPHNPVDAVLLNVSEPLQSAVLSLAGDSVVDFQGPAANDALIQLTTARVLPFSGSWTLAGSGQDFAGLPLGIGGAFTTLTDPGVFAQDGFEGPLSATLGGGAELIDGTSGVTIPNGKRALFVPPNGSATLHLAGPAKGFTQLTMTFLKLSESASQASEGSGIVTAEVAVIGGSKRSVTYLEPKDSTTTAITDGEWQAESSPIVLSVPLEAQGTDVAVRFSVIECGGLPCPPDALVIDDLKLE